MIPTPPPFTPQQRIDYAFQNYPNAQLNTPQSTPPDTHGVWAPPHHMYWGAGKVALDDTATGKPSGPVQYGIGPQSGGHVTPMLNMIDALKANQMLKQHLNTDTYIHGRQGMFGVPPEQLQQMAGDVLYPSPNRFIPVAPGGDPDPVAAARYENTQAPGGYQFSDPNAIWRARQSGVLSILPRK